MLERLPVVVGVGQCTNRIDDLAEGREPLALMTEAARIALDDCRANVAPHVDSVRVINVLSGAYGDPAGALADRLGLGGAQKPAQVYPLFEIALRAHEGRAPAAHEARIAALSASFSRVAATHPHAWFRDAKSAREIATVTAENRMVAYPYPKFMNAIL